MVSHWSLSVSKCPQVSRNTKIIFWPILVMLQFGWSPLFLLFPSLPVLLQTLWWLFQAHQWQLVSPLPLCFLVFQFSRFLLVLPCGQWERQIPLFGSLYIFLLTITRSSRLGEIRWSVRIPKSQRSLCVSFSRTDSGLCIFLSFVWSNLNFLHNSQWITFPKHSCLVLYSFCANLQHLFIMGLIVLSLSPHNLHFYQSILLRLVYICLDIVSL